MSREALSERSESKGYYASSFACVAGSGFTLTGLRQSGARRLPHHGHASAYFSFLARGSYEERAGSVVLEHRPPCLVYHPAGIEHRDAYGDRGGEFLMIEIDAGTVEEWTTDRSRGLGPRVLSGAPALRAARKLWERVATNATPGLPIQEEVWELVAAAEYERFAPQSRPPRWLAGVVERLAAAFADPPSLGDLARGAQVHPAHLCRVFKLHVGCSPTAFVHRRRIEHVWGRLAETQVPDLAEVALDAGFADQSHCNRVFKRLVGAPPGAMRRAFAARTSAARSVRGPAQAQPDRAPGLGDG